MTLLHFAKRPAATLAALSLVLVAACSDSAAPADAPFDAAGTSADLAAANAAFESPVVASFNAFSEAIGTAVGGSMSASVAAAPSAALTTRDRAARLVQKVSASFRAQGLKPSFASSIPAEYAGKTFEYDPGTGEYSAGVREGAPENGVRFLIYAVNPLTGVPAEPLTEVGYAQLTASESGTTSTAHITVVSTEGVTYLSYTVTVHTVTATSGATSTSLGISGFVFNGTDQADFDLSLVIGSSATLDYLLTASNDFSISMKLTTSFNSDITLELEVKGPHGRVTVNGSLTGTEETYEETYTVKVNGDLFATITVTETTATVVGADGGPLSEDERNTLEDVLSVFDHGLDFFNNLLTPGFGG